MVCGGFGVGWWDAFLVFGFECADAWGMSTSLAASGEPK
jgi:hypothetical protein